MTTTAEIHKWLNDLPEWMRQSLLVADLSTGELAYGFTKPVFLFRQGRPCIVNKSDSRRHLAVESNDWEEWKVQAIKALRCAAVEEILYFLPAVGFSEMLRAGNPTALTDPAFVEWWLNE